MRESNPPALTVKAESVKSESPNLFYLTLLKKSALCFQARRFFSLRGRRYGFYMFLKKYFPPYLTSTTRLGNTRKRQVDPIISGFTPIE